MSLRALIVEEDPVTTRLCREALEECGFTVEAVNSGIAAVVAARKDRPDLILIDLQLRDVPGAEAISWLRSIKELEATPIIVLSSDHEPAPDVMTLPRGVTLQKPLAAAEIRTRIGEVLGHIDRA